jgi:hypothetical protein
LRGAAIRDGARDLLRGDPCMRQAVLRR